MKQEEFFKLLDRRLSVIEDSERRDILEEYRQHITMKIKEEGISEEEALADFGDVDDFADEILSAYHVRTEGAAAEKPSKKLLSGIKQAVGSAWSSVRGFFGRCGSAIARFFRGCRTKISALLHREKVPKVPKESGNGTPLWKRGCDWLVLAVKTLLRWCCNLLSGGVSLLAAVAAAFLLVLFGACAVVAFQGYPLVGATMVLFGLLLCFMSAAAFFWSLIRRRQKGASNHA